MFKIGLKFEKVTVHTQSQKGLHFGSNLRKKVPNHNPQHYPHSKEKMLRVVIWHPFFEI